MVRGVVSTMTFLFLLSLPGWGLASEGRWEVLLQALEDKGLLSVEQLEAIRAGAEEGAYRQGSSGGLEVSSIDGRASFELGGRLMIDGVFYDQNRNDLGDGTELRRARIELEGRLHGDWGYELGVDVADGVEVKDAYIAYEGSRPWRVKIGQFKEPFSLEELTSSKYLTFLEKGLPNVFAPGRSIGVGGSAHGEVWTAALGLFGDAYDADPGSEGDEGWAATGRFTWSPLHEERRALHLGAAATWRRSDDEEAVRLRARPESHITDVRYVNTGTLTDVEAQIRYGAEAAVVWGPLSLQGEYMRADLDRQAGLEDLGFVGWYAFASYFLTGESRNYKFKKGAFGDVEPRGPLGAWELAARYSVLDLNDGAVTGGEERNVTVGLNWYLNPQVRIMANYVLVDNDSVADDDGDVAGDDDPRIAQLRFQLDFK